MSTLTSTTDSSPVRVMRVFADFRRGTPEAGVVFVGEERHRIHVSRTTGGLMAQCECPSRCPARPEAIRAFEIMADAWARGRRARPEADTIAGMRGDLSSEWNRPRSESRPYDGPARATCEADLWSLSVPAWAYDEHGLRRPLCEALIAADVWHELHRALDRILSERPAESAESDHGFDGHRVGLRVGLNDRPDVFRYYRASWEPNLGLSQTAYETDFPVEFGEQDVVEAAS